MKGPHDMSLVSTDLVKAMKAEHKRLLEGADALARAIEAVTGESALAKGDLVIPVAPSERKAKGKAKTAKPRAKGGRKPRVTQAEVVTRIRSLLDGKSEGLSAREIEALDEGLNYAGISKALSQMEERGEVSKVDPEVKRNAKYVLNGEYVPAEEPEAPAEEEGEAEGAEIDSSIASEVIDEETTITLGDEEPVVNLGV